MVTGVVVSATSGLVHLCFLISSNNASLQSGELDKSCVYFIVPFDVSMLTWLNFAKIITLLWFVGTLLLAKHFFLL